MEAAGRNKQEFFKKSEQVYMYSISKKDYMDYLDVNIDSKSVKYVSL